MPETSPKLAGAIKRNQKIFIKKNYFYKMKKEVSR